MPLGAARSAWSVASEPRSRAARIASRVGKRSEVQELPSIPGRIDWLAALENWSEKGIAPPDTLDTCVASGAGRQGRPSGRPSNLDA
jgi:hypothetical protein